VTGVQPQWLLYNTVYTLCFYVERPWILSTKCDSHNTRWLFPEINSTGRSFLMKMKCVFSEVKILFRLILDFRGVHIVEYFRLLRPYFLVLGFSKETPRICCPATKIELLRCSANGWSIRCFHQFHQFHRGSS
jgi:hypothetical protein